MAESGHPARKQAIVNNPSAGSLWGYCTLAQNGMILQVEFNRN